MQSLGEEKTPMVQRLYKKELHERWDEFWLADGEQAVELGKALHGFLAKLKDLDAEDYYLLGLSTYSLNQDGVLENSHPFFLKALSSDENYYLARLYSAHCYHDKGDYKSALSEYLKVDQDALKTEMPIWRWVKLLEQVGFCYMKLGQIEMAEPYFEKVINAYIEIEKDELVPVQEAYECLAPENQLALRLKKAENEHFS